MQIEIITKKDLRQFKTELVQELKEALKNNTDTIAKQWLKTPEVREVLGISPGKLQSLRASGMLAYTKIGGIIFYRYSDIMDMLENGGIK